MKQSRLIVVAHLIVAWCLFAGSATAATEEALQSGQIESSQQSDSQFKPAAMKFIQSAQAYIAISTMKWQTFMTNPNVYTVSDISKANAEYQSLVSQQFSELMALPRNSEGLSEKVKDFYAAWGLAFQSMRPTSTDTNRSFPARTNGEMNRMDAMAARLKMDLQ